MVKAAVKQKKKKILGDDSLLRRLYYTPAEPSSYAGIGNLERAVKGRLKRDSVVHWLEAQDAYTLHKPVRHTFQRRSYTVSNIDDVWEADLVDLRSLKEYNDGSTYILVIIDVLSKYTWVEPLRDKTGATVAAAFRSVLARSKNRIPMYLETNKGKEFTNGVLQRLLEELGIGFCVAHSPDEKAAVVERYNLTLKERMWRYFTHRNSRRYIDILQNLVDSYNRTRHSALRMRPADVTLYNATTACMNLSRYTPLLEVITNPHHCPYES